MVQSTVKKLLYSSVGGCLLLLSSIVFAETASTEFSSEAKGMLDRGMAAAKQQEWVMAVNYFNKAQKLSANRPEVLFNLALANDKAGDRELIALAWYRAYLASTPDAANAKQILDRTVALEIAYEAKVRKMIRRVQQIIPGSREFLIADYHDSPIITPDLIESYVDGWYKSLAAAQNNIGDFTAAKKTAPKIRRKNDRSWLYRNIAMAEMKAGNFDAAKATAAKIDSDNEPWVYAFIASRQARLGDISGALKTTTMITDNEDLADAYEDIATEQAEAGDIKGAMVTAAKITEADEKSDAYEEIAEAQAEAGDTNGALETAALITDDEDLLGIYIYDISEQQLKVKDIAGARKTFDLALKVIGRMSAKGEKVSYSIRSELISGLLKLDDLANALKVASGETHDSTIGSVYTEIFFYQLKSGDMPGAKASLAKVAAAASRFKGKVRKKSRLFSYVASIQAALGNIDDAKKAFSIVRVEDYYDWSNALTNIAKAEAKAGDISATKVTINKLTKATYRARSYRAIAEMKAKANDKQWSQQFFSLASKAASKISAEHVKGSAYTNIATMQAQSGDNTGAKLSFALAMKAAAKVTKPSWRVYTYESLASAQSKAGFTKGAAQASAALQQAKTDAELEKPIEKKAEIIKAQKGMRAAALKQWTELAASAYGHITTPAIADFTSFLESLDGKDPDTIARELSGALSNMAYVLKSYREKDAFRKSQMRRASGLD